MYARTITIEIYNQAALSRDRDSSDVIDGIQFLAAIYDRTSKMCWMLHETIWALDDPEIQRPPLHFRCRITLVPYFGHVPDARDFRTRYDGHEYTQDEVDTIQKRDEQYEYK
jgi:NAD+--asparagine ADP-ribosyltransferase